MSASKIPPTIERIIALANEPMLLLDKAFTIIYANASFQTAFGLPEFTPLKNWNFLEITDPSFDVVSLKLLLVDVLQKKQTVTDYEIRSNSNNHKITFNVEAIDTESETFLLLAFNNYKETEQLQSFLQSVLDSTNYGIASYEAIYNNNGIISDFRITYTNPEVPRNFGLNPSDVIGKTCREVYPGIFENGIFERWSNACRPA